MAGTDQRPEPEPSRRGVLFGAGLAGGGLLGTALGFAGGWTCAPGIPGGGAPAAPTIPPTSAPAPGADAGGARWARPGGGAGPVAVSAPVGTDVIPFHGARQAGIDTAPQTHAVFLGLDLRPGTTREHIGRMLRLLTDDAARLTQGRAILVDTEPELAAAPSRLTVTVGFGAQLVAAVAPDLAPSWLRPLPAFAIDRLAEEHSGGDLLLQLCGDDPMSVAHARRMLLKTARSFTTVRWVQTGFRAARGAHPTGATMRNLFGQVDGTANPAVDTGHREKVVWGGGQGAEQLSPWVPGGTSLVLRRIEMDLDAWDELDRAAKEQVIGRRLDTGAPLTGRAEHDEPDLTAVDGLGFPVISDISHLRRSRTDNPDETMLRRAYNYDDGPVAGSRPAGGEAGGTNGGTGKERPVSNTGLLFASYQCDVDRQYVPVQRRLAEADHLNLWTTPVGSAVFAIPPGCPEGGFIGDVLYA